MVRGWHLRRYANPRPRRLTSPRIAPPRSTLPTQKARRLLRRNCVERRVLKWPRKHASAQRILWRGRAHAENKVGARGPSHHTELRTHLLTGNEPPWSRLCPLAHPTFTWRSGRTACDGRTSRMLTDASPVWYECPSGPFPATAPIMMSRTPVHASNGAPQPPLPPRSDAVPRGRGM